MYCTSVNTNTEKYLCILIVYTGSLQSFYYKIINLAPLIDTLSVCDGNHK